MRPLGLTRQSISNWSDIEVAALGVAVGRGAKECASRQPDSYSGADLIDLAKLCALGLNYPAVVAAASRYIDGERPKPLLASAYARLIDAKLHLKDEQGALSATKTMLAAVPYDRLTAETVDAALDYMQFVYTSDALALAVAREPLLLERIRTLTTATETQAAARSSSDTGEPQPLYALYADGVALATLQQLEKIPAAEAAATIAALDAALPAEIAPDDAIPIAKLRRRYDLLGHPLPAIHSLEYLAGSLGVPAKAPPLPAAHAVTALLLFPDWCAQCLKMSSKFPQGVFTVEGHKAHLYGLVVETVSPRGTMPKASEATAPGAFDPADAVNKLRGTPTFAVAPALLEQFAAVDVPYLVLTDAQGIVRVLQPVGEDAINPGETIDSAIARVGAQWPAVAPDRQR